MKKVVFLCATVATAFVATAQNYDEVKNFMMLQNYKKAKELLDKNWSNSKFVSKPEAYILKSTVLAGLAGDPTLAAEAANNRTEAIAALDKYKEMDPKYSFLKDSNSVYFNTPAIIYGSYFNEGIGNYNKKEWAGALEDFKKAVELSDFLISNKLNKMQLDTNGLLLAGASAQSMKNEDEAAKYFVRLADAKVGGKENEFLYQFLAGYYIQKGDIDNFNKYLGYGKQVFPDSKAFDYEDIDYILQMEDETKKQALIEKKMALDPNNYKLQSAIGETIFDQLNSKDTSKPLPENADELEAKMIASFEKANQIHPGNGFSMSNIGNHFINKSVRVAKELEDLKAANRAKNQAAAQAAPAVKPKPGVKPKPATPTQDPEYVAKRDELNKKYNEAILRAGEYYEKAVNIYSKVATPSNIEKQQYRNAVSYLIDINRELKESSKAKPADYDKFEKLEKKWTDAYSKL
jgi:hypothetical protein